MRSAAAAEHVGGLGSWRQLIDLLAQHPTGHPPEIVAEGLIATYRLGKKLTVAQREAGVAALNGRLRSPALLQLLAGDAPQVAAAAIRAAHLSDEEWSELVPELPVRARGFLRSRGGLGPKTRLALATWAGADFRLSADPTLAPASLDDAMAESRTLPADTAEREDARLHNDLAKKAAVETETADRAIARASSAAKTGVSQIGAIVQRIEQWKRNRPGVDSPRLPLGDEDYDAHASPVTEIRFETDDSGTIIWVEGAPRGAIVGTDIARPAYDDGPGPDAYGAAAFAQRMPMENARMNLRGSAIVDGDWRITAAPFFDAHSGRFRGFRGLMRRPAEHEQPALTAAARKRQGESMQQIVHELRTPLGAISGFAEIIEQQLFGPVDPEYRGLASAILADARKLLSGFEDISTAARLDADNLEIDPGQTDSAWLATTLRHRLAAISDSSGVVVNLIFADPVRPFAVEREFAERIFARLFSAIIVAGKAGEVIHGRCKTLLGARVTNCLTLELPEKLRRLSEDALLGAGPTDGDGDAQDALSPLLGLGFSLRLVRNLARKVGGDLRFQNEQALLILPAVQDGDRHLKGTGGD